jgi:hypothetical protein
MFYIGDDWKLFFNYLVLCFMYFNFKYSPDDGPLKGRNWYCNTTIKDTLSTCFILEMTENYSLTI